MSDATIASSGRTTAEGPVHRAFGLLQLVVAAGSPVGVRELGRRAGLSRSTTSRTLGILADLGMVERTPDGGARPGVALATLTQQVDTSPPVLRERLRPLVTELQRRYEENAAAGVDDGAGLLYLVSARGNAAVQVADPVGEVFPFHLVAPGLVAMSWWSRERLEGYLSRPLHAATEHSVTKPSVLRRRLARIRGDGYAWTDQELDLEVNGLAAPIVDGGGSLVAVATLYGPSYRFAESLTPELGPEFAEQCRVLARAAGLAT
jgi:IclR family KDG regulon transcriptional repressor